MKLKNKTGLHDMCIIDQADDVYTSWVNWLFGNQDFAHHNMNIKLNTNPMLHQFIPYNLYVHNE
jgi:hypothetical protein